MGKNKKYPPKIPIWLLKKVIPRYDFDFVKENIQELFETILLENGPTRANLWIWGEALKSLTGFISALLYWRLTMLGSYMKIALRHLKKHKLYAVLNITGLSLGLASCILIFLYVDFEFSFDKFHPRAERIFRPVTEDYAGSSYLFGERLLADVPEIEEVVRFKSVSDFELPILSYGDKHYFEKKFVMADPEIFRVFHLPFVYGNPETALNSPNSLVLTQNTALKYFGHTNPVGEILNYENETNLVVTGVIEDIPKNSHFAIDILASTSANEILTGHNDQTRWSSGNYRTYLSLKEGQSKDFVEQKMTAILLDTDTVYFSENPYHLQALTDIHLYSHLRGEFKDNGDIRFIYFYAAIGMIILLVACINFVNLASAHSLNRSLEVGVRKVLGAERKQVIKQFLGESLLCSWLALPVALLLVKFFLPVFDNLTNTSLSFARVGNLSMIIGLAGITTAIGILLGSYPAFFGSSFSPIEAIRGKKFSQTKRLSFRNILVLVQFMVSAVFICSTLIISSQMRFIHNRDLGIHTGQIINIPLNKSTCEKADLIKNEILNHSGVQSVTVSDFLPSQEQMTHMGGEWEGMEEGDIGTFRYLFVDHDFIETFGIQLLEGRNFSKDIQSDIGSAYILNEAAVKAMGMTSALDKSFKINGLVDHFGEIIGVMKDFHFRSLYHAIDPMVLFIPPGHPKWVFYAPSNMSVKTYGDDIPGILGSLKTAFNKIVPYQPFDYYFFDEDFDKVYRAEQKRKSTYRYFAIFSILIACLGLYGLASFTAQRRTKEMGIRKVVGASDWQLVYLLFKEFGKWVLIANVFAWPIAYFIMNAWLRNFAFRIHIGIDVFILSACLALAVACVTVSFQAVKTALSDPVDSLRYE
ncbi:MAG: ABC transporter permease [Candidatus Aminicenantes bacterium]|nr:MAG: ABC transporter permease [Candidatus Aminicenantes bacterium]